MTRVAVRQSAERLFPELPEPVVTRTTRNKPAERVRANDLRNRVVGLGVFACPLVALVNRCRR